VRKKTYKAVKIKKVDGGKRYVVKVWVGTTQTKENAA